MSNQGEPQVYDQLKATRVVNASGFNLTVLGGQILSPSVLQAMEDANRGYMDMKELLDSSGQMVAELLGAEAAYITSGCCAGMALSAAACMVGDNPEKARELPRVTGMRDEILIHKAQRYKYERCVTIPGAKLVEFGTESGASAEQLEEAITDKTAAILYVAGAQNGALSLEKTVQIGKQYDVPIIVDAAGQVYPVEKMRRYPEMGADLVAHSGKYFGAPNSTGFLCGRRDLIEAVKLHGFIGFEYGPPYTFGRPMKLDRQEIVALVTALREWLTMDHRQRFERYAKQAENLCEVLEDIPDIEVHLYGEPVEGVIVEFDRDVMGKSVAEVAKELLAGKPSVWLHWDVDLYVQAQEPESMKFSVKTMVDGDEALLAERLQDVLSVS
jgi:L-seryl-tRNA(Ser) seleniumtransferase